MAHHFDASTKYLIETRLADWLPLCGRKTNARAEVIDADLSAVTAAADRVLRIHDDPPWVLHLELQSGRDPELPGRLLWYNALLERRHGPPVHSAVVLLRQAADGPELTGQLERGFPNEPPYHQFRYQVVRLWQTPVKALLGGGLGVLPLAPLADVNEAELPTVIQRMEERFRHEATPQEAGVLWTAADILMGLRYPRDLVAQLLRGVHAMKESVTYQAIIEEGMVKARQEDLLRVGQKRLGVVSTETEQAIRAIEDPARLARMIDRLEAVSSWQDLLAS